ncbi:hypothetical protein CB1_002301002 [Camelus ferus]|nr:hypothetical protein CB1_002301002 [Camelus ferus]
MASKVSHTGLNCSSVSMQNEATRNPANGYRLLSSRILDISCAARAWKLHSWEVAKRHSQGEESKAHSSFLRDFAMHRENCEFPTASGGPRLQRDAPTSGLLVGKNTKSLKEVTMRQRRPWPLTQARDHGLEMPEERLQLAAFPVLTTVW